MSEKNQSMIYPAIIYAGIIGGIYILNAVIVDVFDIHFSVYDLIASNVIVFGGLVVAIYAFRKEYNDNMISYSRALGFGVLTALFVGLIMAVYMNILIHYINPHYLDILQDRTRATIMKRVSPDMLSEHPDIMESALRRSMKMQTPVMIFVTSILGQGLFGLIVSLIASIFIKKEPAEPFAGVV